MPVTAVQLLAPCDRIVRVTFMCESVSSSHPSYHNIFCFYSPLAFPHHATRQQYFSTKYFCNYSYCGMNCDLLYILRHHCTRHLYVRRRHLHTTKFVLDSSLSRCNYLPVSWQLLSSCDRSGRVELLACEYTVAVAVYCQQLAQRYIFTENVS